MWDNPRLLNLVAGALVGVALFVFAIAGTLKVLRSDLFPLREIVVVSPLKHTTKEDVLAAVHVGGNFFAVSPEDVRSDLQRLPWVRSASVRRVWPGRLEVEIEEHVALARWGDDALVNTFGERFFGATDAALPVLIGPPGTEAEVARRYASFARIVAPLGSPPDRIVLTPRLAWQMRLSDGLNVMLGRDGDAAEGRLRRFVAVYDLTMKTIGRRHEYVDLRYPNGFALRIGDLKG